MEIETKTTSTRGEQALSTITADTRSLSEAQNIGRRWEITTSGAVSAIFVVKDGPAYSFTSDNLTQLPGHWRVSDSSLTGEPTSLNQLSVALATRLLADKLERLLGLQESQPTLYANVVNALRTLSGKE